jgi:hypothetical protein
VENVGHDFGQPPLDCIRLAFFFSGVFRWGARLSGDVVAAGPATSNEAGMWGCVIGS